MKKLVSKTTIIERADENVEISIDGYVIYSIDYSYGADADGNRGVKTVEVDDLVDLVAGDICEEQVIDLTDIEKAKLEEELIHEFLQG